MVVAPGVSAADRAKQEEEHMTKRLSKANVQLPVELDEVKPKRALTLDEGRAVVTDIRKAGDTAEVAAVMDEKQRQAEEEQLRTNYQKRLADEEARREESARRERE